MARVLMPTMARSYNHNPRGSATATVLMASNNPFERQVSLVNQASPGSMLPGMGYLGADPVPTASQTGAVYGPPAPAAPAPLPTDWSQLLTQVAGGAAQVGTQLAQNRIQQLYGPKATLLPGQSGGGSSTTQLYVPPKSSKMPWIIGGSAVGLGLLVLVIIRMKKK